MDVHIKSGRKRVLEKPAQNDTNEMGQKYLTEPHTGHAKEAEFAPNKMKHYRVLKH